MGKQLTVLVAVLCWAAVASAQTAQTIISYDANGGVTVLPDVALPEDPSWIRCGVNALGGIDCDAATAPISSIVDANGTALPETSDTLQFEADLELSQPFTRWARVGIDANYRPQYSDIELDIMGAVTVSQPATPNSTYTEGASFVWKEVGGATRTFGHPYVFLCTGIALDGVKRYCRFVDGAVDATQDDAEMKVGPCAAVGTMSETVYDTAGTARATIPASCTLNIGRSLDGSDSGTLVSVAASAGTAGPTAPATAFAFTGSNEVSLWAQSSGGGCSSSVSIGFTVWCY